MAKFSPETLAILSSVQGQLGNTINLDSHHDISDQLKNVRLVTPADIAEAQRKGVHVKEDQNAKYSEKSKDSEYTFYRGQIISAHSGLTKNGDFVIRIAGPVASIGRDKDTNEEYDKTNNHKWIAEQRYMHIGEDGVPVEDRGARQRQIISDNVVGVESKSKVNDAESIAKDWVNAVNESDTVVPPFELKALGNLTQHPELSAGALERESRRHAAGDFADEKKFKFDNASNILLSGEETLAELAAMPIDKLPACDRYVLTHFSKDELAGYPIHGKTVEKQKFIAKAVHDKNKEVMAPDAPAPVKVVPKPKEEDPLALPRDKKPNEKKTPIKVYIPNKRGTAIPGTHDIKERKY